MRSATRSCRCAGRDTTTTRCSTSSVMRASMDAVVRYLERVDPEAARRARGRYACFDHYGGDVERYGYAAAFGAGDDCEQEVVAQLIDLRAAAVRYVAQDSTLAADEQFFAEQNARLVANAEAYYRTMFRGRVESWNLRDTHMADTLDAAPGPPRWSHRGLGAQLTRRRRADNRIGRDRRAERGATGPRASRRRHSARRLHDLYGHGHSGE